VLTFDYLGALGASRSSRFSWCRGWDWCGARWRSDWPERAVAAVDHVAIREELAQRWRSAWPAAGAIALLGPGAGFGQKLTDTLDRVAVRRRGDLWRARRRTSACGDEMEDDYRLHLNSHLQFSSRDEYRYHEALVHPGLASLAVRSTRWCSAAAMGWPCARC